MSVIKHIIPSTLECSSVFLEKRIKTDCFQDMLIKGNILLLLLLVVVVVVVVVVSSSSSSSSSQVAPSSDNSEYGFPRTIFKM
jgi:hypothetical protein